MGVGALIRDFFSSGSKKLAKTNRAYYKRSLFLIVACRSLPDPDSWNGPQLENLKKVFGSVQSALDHGTFASKGYKDVEDRFSKANENLEKYLRIYHRGARFGSYVSKDGTPLLTFEEAAQEDGWAKNTLDDFSKTVNEKVELVKRAPYQTIDITFWGPAPVGVVAKGKESLKADSIRVPHFIKIEETARIDTLLHRAMEYATMYDSTDNRPLRDLKSLKLDMSPQFYDTSPVNAQLFKEKKKIVSLTPWITVADLDKAPLHIVPNRTSIFAKSEDLKTAFDSFYKAEMAQMYTNAWPFIDKHGNRSGNSLAVRKRTPSHSLHLWQENEINMTIPKSPPQPLNISSSSTLAVPPIGSSSSITLVPPPFPEPIVMPIPTLRPPTPVSSTSRKEIPTTILLSNEDDQEKSSQNDGKVEILVPNPTSAPQSDQESLFSSSRPETPTFESLDGSTPRIRPTYTARRHRMETEGLGRQEVTAKEKAKPQPRGFLGRIRNLFG